jgi:hypothetical protein
VRQGETRGRGGQHIDEVEGFVQDAEHESGIEIARSAGPRGVHQVDSSTASAVSAAAERPPSPAGPWLSKLVDSFAAAYTDSSLTIHELRSR